MLGPSCSVLSGENFQKTLIIFPRNWELFYSSLKFVVSDLASDQNTLRAGAAPSPPKSFPTSSIKHYDYRVEVEVEVESKLQTAHSSQLWAVVGCQDGRRQHEDWRWWLELEGHQD